MGHLASRAHARPLPRPPAQPLPRAAADTRLLPPRNALQVTAVQGPALRRVDRGQKELSKVRGAREPVDYPRGGGGMRSEKHAPGFRGAFKLQGAGARGLLPPPPPLPSSPSPLFLITFLLA